MGCSNNGSSSEILLTTSNPNGLPASKKLAVDTSTGAEYYNNNGIWAPITGASENLQQVTNIGNITTNAITIGNNLTIKNSTSLNTGILQAINLDGNRTYQLPDASGPLVLTINGNPADIYGNINVSANTAWGLFGNGGTNPSSYFLGTTDDQDFIIKRHNIQSGILNNLLFTTGFGVGILLVNTGTSNTGIGFNSLMANGAGSSNTGIGTNTLLHNISGSFCTAIGVGALQNNTANSNTAMGVSSLISNNVGIRNTTIGAFAQQGNIGGNGNSVLGYSALTNSTAGDNNTVIGSFSTPTLRTGDNNTIIGSSCDVVSSSTSNAICLGFGAIADSNQLVISQSIHVVKATGLPTGAGYILTDTIGNGTLSLQPQVAQEVEEFTSTASQTSFTISHIPKGRVAMYVGGLLISRTTYNVSGITITYSGIPLSSGTRINFSYIF